MRRDACGNKESFQCVARRRTASHGKLEQSDAFFFSILFFGFQSACIFVFLIIYLNNQRIWISLHQVRAVKERKIRFVCSMNSYLVSICRNMLWVFGGRIDCGNFPEWKTRPPLIGLENQVNHAFLLWQSNVDILLPIILTYMYPLQTIDVHAITMSHRNTSPGSKREVWLQQTLITTAFVDCSGQGFRSICW